MNKWELVCLRKYSQEKAYSDLQSNKGDPNK